MNGSLPPLPAITDQDLILSVYSAGDDYLLDPSEVEGITGPKRLAQLGKRVMDQAVAFHYFRKTNPVLSAQDIDHQREVNAPNYAALLQQYGLRSKIRYSQGYVETPESAQQFFERYLAAAFLSHGMGVIQEWVSQTIDPGSEIPHQPMGEVQSNLSTGFGHMQRPMPPAGLPPSQPPPPSYSYYSSGATPSQPVAPPNVQVLAQLNMTAQKHHLSVTYPARMEGLSHSPTWHVQCCLNGEVRGQGSGQNQKQAKEMAARQAWVNMGWDRV